MLHSRAPTVPVAVGFFTILILGLSVFYWASAETIKMMNLQREKIGHESSLCMRKDVPVKIVTVFAAILFFAVLVSWSPKLSESLLTKAEEPASEPVSPMKTRR